MSVAYCVTVKNFFIYSVVDNRLISTGCKERKLDRQCAYNVTLWCVRLTIVVVERKKAFIISYKA